MEYIEMAAASKDMFDKMISNDGLRVAFGTNLPGAPGFRPLPLPVFSHGKPLSSVGMAPVPPSGSGSELSRRGIPSFGNAGMPLNGTQMAVVHNGNEGIGMMHLQLPGESGSSLQGDDLIEKGKRSRGEGGKGSRGGGTSSRKRTRGGQADSQTSSGAIREASVNAALGQTSGRSAPSVPGTRLRQNSSGEKADKTRKGGQGAKRGDKKQSQMLGSDDLPQNLDEVEGFPSGYSTGILDIYGLRARPMDVSRFMVDIPLDNLLSRNFEVPSFSLKNSEDIKTDVEDHFGQLIDGVLHLLPKHPATGMALFSKVSELSAKGSSKILKDTDVVLDLEHSVHPEEEGGVSRVEKRKEEIESDEVGADRKAIVNSKAGQADCIVASQDIDDQQVHSVESFLSRLKRISSDPLPPLIPLASADGEMSGSFDSRSVRETVDLCHRSGSVPPLFFSHAHVGPLRPETSRYNPRVWVRAPTAENSGGDGGTGSNGKEASNVAEEDATMSPSSHKRKFDGKAQVQLSAAIHRSTSGTPSLSSGQVFNNTTLTMEDPTVKEEPRQVENAVGFNSEGSANPVEIDSGSGEKGSAPLIGAGRIVVPTHEVDCHRGSGDAVRPLETPAALAGLQEMDSLSDRQGKPSTVIGVKQEKNEPAVKDTGDSSGVAGHEPNSSKQDSVGLPGLDLKVNIRSSSPTQIELPPSLPARPNSPGAQAAARLLCNMANSTMHFEQEKSELEGEKRRRVFQSYPGAPAQKSTKIVRVGNSSSTPGDAGREWKRSADGGSGPPSKAFVSERRKSLSQVNDASDKPLHMSPRNFSSGGISTGSRGGNHTGSRSNNLSTKSEKVAAREISKEPLSIQELAGRGSSSLPPLSSGGPPSKNGQKTVKTNSYLHSGDAKGSVAIASIAKVPAAPTTQRVISGGTSSRSSRTNHTSNSIAAHGSTPQPYKTSRQVLPENRQKTKTEVPSRGSKINGV